MANLTVPLSNQILTQLKAGEKRILSLVVAVRRSMDRSEGLKGDLTEQVRSSLGKLVACEMVVESDGLYSIKRAK